ncbi:MAG: type II/IV secretion system protein [Planctomycetes bacterium]|nr:type II/IV secretion system protein [Planctomycetota bacterium]
MSGVNMVEGLGDVLVRHGALDAAALAAAEAARQPDERLDQTLLRLNAVAPQPLAAALAEYTGLELVSLGEAFEPDPALLAQIPTRLVFAGRFLPYQRGAAGLTVATCDPFRLDELDELRILLGESIEACLAPIDEVEGAIRRLYGVGADALDRAATEGAAVDAGVVETESDEEHDDAALVQFVNKLLWDAVEARASDVHVEPTERELRVRYRIDGVMQPARLPRELKRFQAAIVSRLKIMAKMDIAERRLPQDGRIRLGRNGRELDVRVSVLPTLFGEGLALRILDQGAQGSRDLSQLGMSPEHSKTLADFLALPHGIVLVTGPTGSGKSTTLYGGLMELDRDALKIITVEDPVEYRLSGVSQIQVHAKIGLTFSRGLRSILRHDPDVVMIGEIRDTETAQIAVQASLTGHLVLSTLHTNDAAGALPRLIDMGVEPYLVAATVEGLMAQRLVRRICPACREPHPHEHGLEQLLAELGVEPSAEVKHGAGCSECFETGYRGRAGIFELVPVSDALRELASENASAVALRTQVRKEGNLSLRDDGVRLLRAGTTTPAEVVRVTRAE